MTITYTQAYVNLMGDSILRKNKQIEDLKAMCDAVNGQVNRLSHMVLDRDERIAAAERDAQDAWQSELGIRTERDELDERIAAALVVLRRSHFGSYTDDAIAALVTDTP